MAAGARKTHDAVRHKRRLVRDEATQRNTQTTAGCCSDDAQLGTLVGWWSGLTWQPSLGRRERAPSQRETRIHDIQPSPLPSILPRTCSW